MNKWETWKDIPEYIGLYKVSNLGNIKSSRRSGTPERILRQSTNRFGYKYITLSKSGVRINKLVHRMVAISFLENKECKEQVNHINGIKDDNRTENLEWCTCSENHQHAFRIGLHSPTIVRGEKSGVSKLNNKQVLEIRDKYIPWKYSSRKLEKEYGVDHNTILFIVKNRTWTHI